MSTESDTNRYRTEFAGVGYDAPEGGFVAVREGGTATAIGPVKQAPEGWALGPLEVAAPEDSRVVLDSFQYREPAGSSSLLDGLLSRLPLAGLALPAVAEKHNPPEEQEQVSRRDVVKAGVVALGGASLAASARADTPGDLTVADCSVYENDHGMGLQLWDGVTGVLPSDMEYSVLAGGDPVDSFGVDSTAVVPPGVTGDVVVRADASLSMLQSLQWSAFGHQPITYEFELDKAASAYDAGTERVLSRQSLVTEPLSAAGGSGATMALGDVSIPHRSEGSSSFGEYYVRDDDGALVYKTGRGAPDAREIEVTVQADRHDEYWDDIQREW